MTLMIDTRTTDILKTQKHLENMAKVSQKSNTFSFELSSQKYFMILIMPITKITQTVFFFFFFFFLLYVPSQQLWSLRDGQFT